MQFSARNRQAFKDAIAGEVYDILVIGGGITGAGIALDAAARGLKVALIEKNDFAHGTSSRSTKLIHGGLRYLKQLEIALVREVGQERAILHHNAPHIVIPEKMLLPIIEGGSLGKYSTSLGLYVYDRLAGVQRNERRKMLSKEETLQLEPQLRQDILKGGGVYIEYRTDDARLVIEVLKTAVEKGALPINYCEAVSFIYEEKQVAGVVCRDSLQGDSFTIKARKVINAAGPWVDKLRKLDNSLNGKRLHLTKGVHLVVSKDRLPLRQSVYFDIPGDGRMMFAIPRGKVVYLGTTDTSYTESPDHPLTTEEDVAYVLKATNHMFPAANLSPDDVISTWAGLRPLIHEDGKSPSELSRKDEIFVSASGLLSMAGGKLTGFRKMAERVVDMVAADLSKSLHKKFAPCSHTQPAIIRRSYR
jgi:glycerol-3-phosphate dehydrogenase